jgi:hypothetical protein
MRPRIRSVKPEYATDGKILRLSDSTALFFVLLWAHCDDDGYFEWDSHALSVKTGLATSRGLADALGASSSGPSEVLE